MRGRFHQSRALQCGSRSADMLVVVDCALGCLQYPVYHIPMVLIAAPSRLVNSQELCAVCVSTVSSTLSACWWLHVQPCHLVEAMSNAYQHASVQAIVLAHVYIGPTGHHVQWTVWNLLGVAQHGVLRASVKLLWSSCSPWAIVHPRPCPLCVGCEDVVMTRRWAPLYVYHHVGSN